MRHLLALALLLAGPALAHDLWIEPSSFHPAPGTEVRASLRVGQKLQGDPLPRIPGLVEAFVLVGTKAEAELGGEPGADPAGVVRVPSPGLHWIAYQSGAFPLALDAAKFEEHLRDEGLERVSAERKRAGLTAAPARERFYRCAKSLLDAGGEADAGVAQTRLGLTLELVPGASPLGLRDGERLPLTLVFRKAPMADALVVAMRKDAPDEKVSARTDAQGRVSLPLRGAGLWLVKAVHMEAAPAASGFDWQSWWASITFERGRAAK